MKLYIGHDEDGDLALSVVRLIWHLPGTATMVGCWESPRHDTLVLCKRSGRVLKAILKLDRWPEPGEMLIYDTVKEEGEIVGHE